MTLLLTRKALVAVQVEAVEGVDEVPVTASESILVSDPAFTPDLNLLQRNVVLSDLGHRTHQMGRKLAQMTFDTEIKSNGATDSGLIADVDIVGQLLRGCGLSETAQATTGTIGPIVEIAGNLVIGQVSWAATTGSTFDQPVHYDIVCTTGGITGVAEVSITPDAQAIADSLDTAQTAVILTTTTAVDLKSGGSGAQITPTFSGTITTGDAWKVVIYPESIIYRPISTGFESITIYMFLDGIRHRLVGARGAFTFNAQAGEFGTFSWTFWGQWTDPTDTALPTDAIVASTLPPMLELAKLRVADFNAIVETVTFDQGNSVLPRPDISSDDGFNGYRITDRLPVGGINPEMDLLANEDFWAKLSAATTMRFMCRFGTVAGNTIWFIAPNCQYSGMSYADRDGIRVLDAGLAFARDQGDDEYELVFA